jgi:hypothetical protein
MILAQTNDYCGIIVSLVQQIPPSQNPKPKKKKLNPQELIKTGLSLINFTTLD